MLLRNLCFNNNYLTGEPFVPYLQGKFLNYNTFVYSLCCLCSRVKYLKKLVYEFFNFRSMAQLENPTIVTSTQNRQAPQLEKTPLWVATTVIQILIIIATVFGNTLVLITTWLHKRLHQPNKYFIACLAVADLLVGIFSVPIRLYLRFNMTNLMEVHLCRFWFWIDIFCEAASIITLTIISIDRHIKIRQPFKYKSQITTSRSFIIIFFIWLISAIFATLAQFSYGGSRAVFAIVGRGCLNDNLVYFTILAVLLFFLPTLIIVTMYTSIFCAAHKRKKLTRNGTLGHSFIHDQNLGWKAFRRELKTIRMLFLVVCTFIVCWGPFFIYFLLLSYQPTVALSLGLKNMQILETVFVNILPSFNSLCNPIIYACLDQEYNKAFKHFFRRIFCFGTLPRKSTKLSRSSSTQISRLKKHRNRGTSTSIPACEIQDNCQTETRLL